MKPRPVRLDLPLLLPDIKDERDECVARLLNLLERRDGVTRAHVVQAGEMIPGEEMVETIANGSGAGADGPQLCLHYDPERLTLAQVIGLAKAVGAGVTDRYAHAVIPFRAIGSEDDGQRIEDVLRGTSGITATSVNFAGQIARVEYDKRRIDLPSIERVLRDLDAAPTSGADHARAPERGLDAHLRGDHATRAAETKETPEARAPATVADTAVADEQGFFRRNRELVWSLISGLLLSTGWILGRAGAPELALIGIFAAAYVFGAWDNVRHFVADLRKGRLHFNIDLLMLVAAIGAAILGQWLEGALLLFLFSLGHALEHYALGRARNAIKALAELSPQVALVRQPAGDDREVAIGDVKPGDLVVVKPGERIPVDGSVAEGRSAVNQAPITGESMPVGKAVGDGVFAGSVNGEGSLLVTVTVAIGDRTLDRVVRLVSEAETQKAPTQQFTDRFERIFVPVVLVVDVLLIVVPPALGLWTWSESFYRAMAVLVAASPCALALGTPAAVLAGIAQAARNGVLIKGGAHLETLGAIGVLALDKTGTITVGEPSVTNVIPAAGVPENNLLGIAAAVERQSQHPLARAVVRRAEERSIEIPASGELESITARGVRAKVGNEMVEIGRLLLFEDAGAKIPDAIRASVTQLEDAGRSTMTIRATAVDGSSRGERWLGVLGLADQPREGVSTTLDRLRELGIRRIVMLTGDNKGVGDAVGKAVGIDEVRAGLLPEDKVTAIKELAAEGWVAMIGDGVNDAPALAHATVGIAMGGAGTAAALETADVALMGDDLGRLPFLIGLSRKSRAVIRQNLYVSLGVIGLLFVATVTGAAGIGAAVVVHEGSTLVVIANALRLLRYRE